MNIKNPEIVLQKIIRGIDGREWQVCEVSKLADAESNSPMYEFKLITNLPLFNGLTKQRKEKVELTIFNSLSKEDTLFELYCNGQMKHGYMVDIDTKEKFIQQLEDMLPII